MFHCCWIKIRGQNCAPFTSFSTVVRYPCCTSILGTNGLICYLKVMSVSHKANERHLRFLITCVMRYNCKNVHTQVLRYSCERNVSSVAIWSNKLTQKNYNRVGSEDVFIQVCFSQFPLRLLLQQSNRNISFEIYTFIMSCFLAIKLIIIAAACIEIIQIRPKLRS